MPKISQKAIQMPESPIRKLVPFAEGAKKFRQFTGKRLVTNTRMTIGVFGDAYVNFGYFGGQVFMFFFGLFMNIVIQQPES